MASNEDTDLNLEEGRAEEEEDLEMMEGLRSLNIRRVPSTEKQLDAAEWPQQCANQKVEEVGDVFLGGLNRIINQYERSKRNRRESLASALLKDDSFAGGEAEAELDPRDSEVLSKNELEILYIEALYTIKHKIGTTSDGHLSVVQDLFEYTRQAFDISTDEHDTHLLKVNEEKPPIVVAEVTVVEARSLEAKDADGFSDPYCMLGIKPATGSSASWREQRSDSSPVTSASSSPSLPKKSLSTSSSVHRKKTALDQIPARFIKTTSVQSNTLDPVWNEKFRFDLDDVHSDRLHLDIWDHDDDFSVIDYAKKLNQVKGMKGLSRYFKQIAQSARTNNEEEGGNVDDFLGTLDVALVEIPSTGLDKWFDLKGRSSRSKAEGQLHLILNLATREDRGLSEEDILFEARQHRDLISVFLDYEFNKSKEIGENWTGELSKAAKTILHQHAIQGDITETQEAVCYWMAYSRQFRKKSFDWQVVVRCLDDLESKWNRKSMYREETEALALSFERYIEYCLKVVSKESDSLTFGSKKSPEKLNSVLSCLARIYSVEIYQKCCPFKKDLKFELSGIIKKKAEERYSRLQTRRKSERTVEDDVDSFNQYTITLNKLNSDMYAARDVLTPVFLSTTEVKYFSIVYKQTHRLLSKDLCRDLDDLLPLMSFDDLVEGAEETDFTEEINSAQSVLKLYLSIRQFYGFTKNLTTSDREKLGSIKYNDAFATHLERWLKIINVILLKRVRLAVELDKLDQLKGIDNGDVKQSSSAVDVSFSISQVAGFWRNIRWQDEATEEKFVYDILEIICSCAVAYVDQMFDKLHSAGYYDDGGQFDVTEQVCIILNDMEQVRRSLQPLAKLLDFDEIYGKRNDSKLRGAAAEVERSSLSSPPSSSSPPPPPSRLSQRLVDADALVVSKIKQVTDRVADKMRPDIKKLVFRLCWTPEKAESREAIQELMNYLDSNLLTLNVNLLRANFDKILESIWIQVLEEIKEVTTKPDEELQKSRWIFGRLEESLKILVDFFHADGKGLPNSVVNSSLFEEVSEHVEMNKSTVDELIEIYLEEKINQQKKTASTEFGTLSVRLYFRPETGSLIVEVLKAQNLIPLDVNGFSDPFVIVELWPRRDFFEEHRKQTQVVKKSLNPTFDETFEFHVNESQRKLKTSAIVFTVMDYDYLSSDEFAGEIYLPLNGVAGFGQSKTTLGRSPLIPLLLPLMHWKGQTEKNMKIKRVISALSKRTDKRDDLVFMKQRAKLETE